MLGPPRLASVIRPQASRAKRFALTSVGSIRQLSARRDPREKAGRS